GEYPWNVHPRPRDGAAVARKARVGCCAVLYNVIWGLEESSRLRNVESRSALIGGTLGDRMGADRGASKRGSPGAHVDTDGAIHGGGGVRPLSSEGTYTPGEARRIARDGELNYSRVIGFIPC